MNEEIKTTAANGKLSTIFLVVLGLHVAVIVAFIAYNLLKGNTPVTPEIAEVAPSEEAATMTEKDSLPEHNPSVETDFTAAPESDQTAQNEANSTMSMPSPSDPIYNNAGEIKPRVTERVLPAGEEFAVVEAKTEKPRIVESSYTVKKGDSLAKIARNNKTTIKELQDVNKLTGDVIKIGQIISIPGNAEGKVSAQNTVKSAAVPRATLVGNSVPVKAGLSEYTVAPGDTLWKIAKSFNTQPSEIAKLNGITDPAKLKVGSTIKVPTSSSQEALAPKAVPVRTNVQNTDVAMIPQEKRQ